MSETQDDRLENEFKEKPLYDRLYTKEKSAFGGLQAQPEQFVGHLGELLQEGLALEVGAGQGRNALWLARQGLVVEANDLSKVGVEQMIQTAKEESLLLTATIADLREPLVKEYDAVIGTYVFHHIPKEDALAVIADFKEHTKVGGYNVVAVFTTEGDFYTNDPLTDKWYPKPGELKEIYEGWEIVRYEESAKKALAKQKDGTDMFNIVARILARKK